MDNVAVISAIAVIVGIVVGCVEDNGWKALLAGVATAVLMALSPLLFAAFGVWLVYAGVRVLLTRK